MKLNNVPVTIDLDKAGIYDLGIEGSTGKSYLYTLLRHQAAFTPNDVLPLTYMQGIHHYDITSNIVKFPGRILLLDRFDLYFHEDLCKALKTKCCITLLDLKDFRKWWSLPRKDCNITLSEEGIRVWN